MGRINKIASNIPAGSSVMRNRFAIYSPKCDIPCHILWDLYEAPTAPKSFQYVWVPSIDTPTVPENAIVVWAGNAWYGTRTPRMVISPNIRLYLSDDQYWQLINHTKRDVITRSTPIKFPIPYSYYRYYTDYCNGQMHEMSSIIKAPWRSLLPIASRTYRSKGVYILCLVDGQLRWYAEPDI